MHTKLFFTLILSLVLTTEANAFRPAEEDGSSVQYENTPSSNVPAPEAAPIQVEDTSPAPAEESAGMPEAPPVEVVQQQSGDVVQMTQPESTAQGVILIDFPKRGMDMSKVLNELGEPVTRYPAIGNPPITRWVYPDRTVFFEYSHVIHVVAR